MCLASKAKRAGKADRTTLYGTRSSPRSSSSRASGRSRSTGVAGLLLGADDFIVKPFDPGELVARARFVIRQRLPQYDVLPASAPKLTPREGEVLELLAGGRRQKEIARELYYQPQDGRHPRPEPALEVRGVQPRRARRPGVPLRTSPAPRPSSRRH
jgi:hypothetical protein